MRKSHLLLVGLSMFAFFALAMAPVSAHPPTNMTLVYELSSHTLSVTVFHSVGDPNTHYIEYVTINKNGAFETDRNYTSQASATAYLDVFNIDAVQGDVLQVTAYCNQGGQITDQVTVSGGLQTQPQPNIPGFPIAAIAIGIMVAVGFTLLRRKSHPAS
ncbi:MAG: Loki-CTERM sorting domain-containing protein [Candidatus Hermodarchaeia archaeon]